MRTEGTAWAGGWAHRRRGLPGQAHLLTLALAEEGVLSPSMLYGSVRACGVSQGVACPAPDPGPAPCARRPDPLAHSHQGRRLRRLKCIPQPQRLTRSKNTLASPRGPLRLTWRSLVPALRQGLGPLHPGLPPLSSLPPLPTGPQAPSPSVHVPRVPAQLCLPAAPGSTHTQDQAGRLPVSSAKSQQHPEPLDAVSSSCTLWKNGPVL